MSQSLPVLTGTGSLLGITESPQSALVSGVKGVSSAGGFSTVMSQTAIQQKTEMSPENETGGNALPSGGAGLPLDAVQGDGLNDKNVAVDEAAGMAEGQAQPNQTVEEIERFLAVELNVEQIRSEFSRPEIAQSRASLEVVSQAGILPGTILSPANSGVEMKVSNSLLSAAVGNPVAVRSGQEGLHPMMPSTLGGQKTGSVLSEYSTGLQPQVMDAVQGWQRGSADVLVQSPVPPSGIDGQEVPIVGLEAVKAPVGGESGMPVSIPVKASDALARAPGFVESDYIPKQAELPSQFVSSSLAGSVSPVSSDRGVNVTPGPVFSDPAVQVAAVMDLDGEVKPAAVPLVGGAVVDAVVPLAGALAVDAAALDSRQKQSAEQPAGRDGANGRVPLDAGSLGATANVQEGESNSSLADRLARLQSTNVSQAEQSPTQKSTSLSAVDQMTQDKVGVELKGESSVENLAASIAAAAKVAKPQSDVFQLPMPNGVKPGAPAWNQAVNERIVLVSSQNGRVAEIQLDPPELGSLQVKLQVKNDQVSVVFNTPHGAVRDALEQGMPRLREMFAEQGLSLTDSSVEDQTAGQNREGSDERQNASSGHSGFDEDGDGPVASSSQRESLSLVDYYA